jgi:hypothetical protein
MRFPAVHLVLGGTGYPWYRVRPTSPFTTRPAVVLSDAKDLHAASAPHAAPNRGYCWYSVPQVPTRTTRRPRVPSRRRTRSSRRAAYGHTGRGSARIPSSGDRVSDGSCRPAEPRASVPRAARGRPGPLPSSRPGARGAGRPCPGRHPVARRLGAAAPRVAWGRSDVRDRSWNAPAGWLAAGWPATSAATVLDAAAAGPSSRLGPGLQGMRFAPFVAPARPVP